LVGKSFQGRGVDDTLVGSEGFRYGVLCNCGFTGRGMGSDKDRFIAFLLVKRGRETERKENWLIKVKRKET
jgi:hypothetical protein